MLLPSVSPFKVASFALSAALLATGAIATEALAQEEPAQEGTKPVVVPPQLLSAPEVPYPENGAGKAVVAVELLVSVEGTVQEAAVVEGDEPFSSIALASTRDFRFEPASVDGVPRAAKILYRIEFVPPVFIPEPEPEEPESDTPVPPESSQEEEQEVTVQGVRRPGVGRVMSDAETQIIPGAEGDPIRAIDATPGTVPIIASGPFIGLRGASPGMVGYQFDGIELPYLFHIPRGPAVVHPWMVSSASLHGGGAPGRLGRAIGGFIEAAPALPEGRHRVAARVRLTDSALGAEAPFAEGRGSVLVGGRYSYTRPVVSLIAPEFGIKFWDYQTRIRYAITPTDHIEVLGFGAGDRSSVIPENEPREDLFHASMHRAAIRYTKQRGAGASHQLGITVGHDRWDGRPSQERPNNSSVQLRATSIQPVSNKSWFEVGGDLNYRLQNDFYDEFRSGQEPILAEYTRDDVLVGAWADWTYSPSQATTMTLGVRLDLYSSTETPVDDAATQGAVQPRLALSHQLNKEARLHTSAGVLAQPQTVVQVAPGRTFSPDGGLEYAALSDFGMELTLPAGFSFDATVFQGAFFNVGDVEHLYFVDGQQGQEFGGRGQAYGLELSLKRMLAKRLRGFLSYTLSRSWRSVGRVRGLAEFDRPHVVDGALAYDFGKGWSLTSRATYYRGFPALMTRVERVEDAPRATDHYQVDWQAAKRWKINESGAWWGVTMGVLNTTLRSEANDFYCDDFGCEEELVGPATIPTFGLEGEY